MESSDNIEILAMKVLEISTVPFALMGLVITFDMFREQWWTVQSMVFAVVLFTLLVQGPTSGRLIRRLGVSSD